jgi:trehalose 6-phosphate synthase
VRRLAALALTIALAWIIVVRAGAVAGSGTALALGVALVAASIVGWLGSFVKLPRITGYLVVGLVCGPSLANLITDRMARDLEAVTGFAVVVIAVTAGLHLDVLRSRERRRASVVLVSVAMLAAWVALGALLYVAWPWLPIGGGLTGWTRLAAAALGAALLTGASPAVAMAVVTEGRARGALAELASIVTVVFEIELILLVAVCLAAARLVLHVPDPQLGSLAASIGWTLAGSTAFGVLVGAAFTLYLRYVGREITVVLLAVCAFLSVFSARLEFEPLLVGLAAGLLVQAQRPGAATVLHDAIEHGAMPALVLYFAALGASLHLDALASVGLMAAALAAVRVLLVRETVRLGARVAGLHTPEGREVWRAVVPTAGVVLGLAAGIALEFPDWGGRLQATVIAVAAISQLVGPVLFRDALVSLREIGGSTSGLVVVSNREPWIHERQPDGSIQARATPGGVAVALDALMRERGGVWVAHGAGSADRDVVDDRQSVEVPPDAPAYRLRRLWLTAEQEARYYAGFSNGALWPLCHQAHVKPVFRAEDWEAYQDVNRLFADAVAVEAPPECSVFLNDYHLALVGRGLRARRPLLRTALFWHIPWPDVDRLRICPWRRELLQGLLGNDLLAFQLPRDQRNFLAATVEELGATVSGETVYLGDRPVRVVASPIGADFDRITSILGGTDLHGDIERLSAELDLEGKIVGVGVDRLDYTKGIPERLAAIDRVLTDRPELAWQFAFVQIGVPSRGEVPAYAQISGEIEEIVTRINARHGRGGRGPIRYVTRSLPLPELVALYRLARFCVVSSLHDGMNLVAKEFVSARDDFDGVLILSELAGAAQELDEALIINPYDERGFTAAVARAIDMPSWERRRRMQALRRRVAGHDVLAWASDILERLERRKGLGFLSG